jgi:hypothetical protein
MVDLKTVFDQLRSLFIKYQPPFQSKRDESGYFDLWSIKELVIDGRKRKEIFFAGIIIQKSYVGFYYMPVYAEPEVKQFFKPELLKLLKGKSCFYVRKVDSELLKQIEDALALGFAKYKERGWV